MKRSGFHRLLLALGALLGSLCVMAIAGMVLFGVLDPLGTRKEFRQRESLLGPLVQKHASRDQVVEVLGLEFTDYSIGSTNRPHLDRYPPRHPEVYRRVRDYPGVLFHTTANWMTWLFFDSEGKLQEYCLVPQ